MYVIATVSCPNFHFSVSPHVPFLNLLFEQIANSNEYLLFACKIWLRYSRERTLLSLPPLRLQIAQVPGPEGDRENFPEEPADLHSTVVPVHPEDRDHVGARNWQRGYLVAA